MVDVQPVFRLEVKPIVANRTAIQVLFGDLRIARLTFIMRGELAEIGIIKNFPIDPKITSRFREQFSVFPAEYLLDELSRRGAKGYKFTSLNPDGRRLLGALLKRRILLNGTHSKLFNEFKLSTKAHSNALRRKRIP
jgi:hypothetical protein